MEKENLELWKSVSKTDPKHIKKVTFGRKFSAIDAYSQIHKATELWGPFGGKWGTKDETFTPLGTVPDVIVLYKGICFYPGGEFPLASAIAMTPYSGKHSANKLDDDCIKKVRTDALTKGLSMLGFNADVFLGMFDDNKYVKEMEQLFSGTTVGRMSELQLGQYQQLYNYFIAKYGDEESAKQALREEFGVDDLKTVGFTVFDKSWQAHKKDVEEFENPTGGQ